MNLPQSETPTGISRRFLMAAAALGGLGVAVLGRSTASAAPGDTPTQPSDSDREMLRQVIGIELAASELYQTRLDAGVSDNMTILLGVLVANHEAYAQAVAGRIGASAGGIGRDDAVFDDRRSDFSGDVDTFVTAAHDLEQTLVATHNSMLADYDSTSALTLIASISTVEARQATVFADIAGVSDLDVVFGNDSTPIDPAATGS